MLTRKRNPLVAFEAAVHSSPDATNVDPIAEEGLKQIKIFYRIEAQIKGLSADERRAIRQEKKLPPIEAFEPELAYSR